MNAARVHLVSPCAGLIAAVAARLPETGRDFSRTWVVFPERRPAYYLRKTLAERLGAGFIPMYFDATYDLFRGAKYDLVQAGGGTGTTMAWYASLGTSFLDDLIVFNVGVDAPFTFGPDTADITQWPHLRAVFVVGDELIKGLSLEASYDKKLIKNFASLVSPEEAAIQARLNYQIQVAVLSFVYKLRYDEVLASDGDPDTKPWIVTSGIETSIALPF